ncbi:putative MFS family arabinose efflux permease [Heliophilum fasciatum]|uniref:Putative MFS family arabinose efflux permease n=2 Tax=Heliophilum fasciatum TaxID=35700 RepID=A0A4R2RYQ6_9FIRM|nr:putative MFS family arabinose efflux permease [Heliophilum fasciatum]
MKHKNFRYYWLGMCVSLIGTWMQNIAQPWLAYSLTKSPFLLSLVGTLQFTPILFFSLFAGAMIDKFPKKRILLYTQSASLIITLLLALLVWTEQIQYWHILTMSFALGVVNTLDMPSRQSFVIELVGKEDLMNAIALNSMAFNTARIIGPAIAGLIMGYFGIAFCFFLNAISFAAVLCSLLLIKPRPIQTSSIQTKSSQKHSPKKTNLWGEIKEGLVYIYHQETIFNTLVVVAIVGMFATNFNVLVPVFAKEILAQNETGFGLLMSFVGFGSLLGALAIATFNQSGPKKSVLYLGPFVVGAFLIITGFTNLFLLTGISLAVAGFFFITFISSANSTLQLHASNEYRGRVMSVYTLAFVGATPLGNLYAGMFTEHFNARIGFTACGVAIMLLMLLRLGYKRKQKP